MDDTRETRISLSKTHPSKLIKADNELGKDVKEEFRPKPRFKKGDLIISACVQKVFKFDHMDCGVIGKERNDWRQK